MRALRAPLTGELAGAWRGFFFFGTLVDQAPFGGHRFFFRRRLLFYRQYASCIFALHRSSARRGDQTSLIAALSTLLAIVAAHAATAVAVAIAVAAAV